MDKLFITTTIPFTLRFFKGNLAYYSRFFDVCAISSEKEKLEDFGRMEGVRTYHLPMKRSISLAKDWLSLLKFIRLFVKERPQIVHGNTPKAGMLSMIAAWLTRVPVRIYMCHGLRYQQASGVLRKILVTTEKMSCACATEVICVSHGVRQMLVDDGICSSHKAVVIGNGSAGGVNLQRFSREAMAESESIREKLKIPQNAFVFIFVGRMVGDKGVNELVHAFVKAQQTVENSFLILVGWEEPDLDPLQNATKEEIKCHTHIHYVGYQDDVRPYYMAANAVVLPSHREGLGHVLLEAAAMQIPGITTDIVGCNEVIQQDVNGSLVPVKDEKALLEQFIEWASHPQKVESMALTSYQLVREKFDKERVSENMLKEYQRLVTFNN